MTDQIRHRGPDAEGFWFDFGAGIALGHRRLSILELSDAGAQPMHSADGRFVLIFNGEIYNHWTLRSELEAVSAAPAWSGHSDTETLLAAIAHWGLVTALKRACGMFSIALWDRRESELAILRDRLGEKPLYYTRTSSGWAFASELKALILAPSFKPRLDRSSVNDFLTYGYVPDGKCIYASVSKVPPGHIVRLSINSDMPVTERYETFGDLAFPHGSHNALESGANLYGHSIKIEGVLTEVIGEQMLSDVPLGCFLSGGVDSSLVASLMQAGRPTQVNTFSIGFSDSQFNEAPHAARVARHLGTAHTEFLVSEADALAVVADLPFVYDEPFADASQIPTLLLCRAARRDVTVALTGDGADEIFGGYNRHVLGPQLWRRVSRIPVGIRKPLGRFVCSFDHLSVAENSNARKLARRLGLPLTFIDKLSRVGKTLGAANSIEDLYRYMVTTFGDRKSPVTASLWPTVAAIADLSDISGLSSAEWMMAMDTLSYLPGDILVKVDRAAMSASLETRAPFLDARVVRAAWNLPIDARIRDKQGKVVLREILSRHVPREMTDRPKQGFAIPLDRWLRGALRSWAEELLVRQDLLSVAGLDADMVTGLWDEHQSNRRNNGQKLWTVLMLLAWLDIHIDCLDIPANPSDSLSRDPI